MRDEPTFLLLPTWSLIHSRFWKAQIPYLARHHRVVTFDGRGNGRSDRPQDPHAYAPTEFAADALAVLDATGTDTAITVSLSAGTLWNLYLSARHPEHISGAVFVGPVFPLSEEWPEWTRVSVLDRRDQYGGAQRYNVNFIREHLREFAQWWAEQCALEPHSTMAIEYMVDWALEADGETIAHTLGPVEEAGAQSMSEVFGAGLDAFVEMARTISCPVLVLQGELDVGDAAELGRGAREGDGRPLPPAARHESYGRPQAGAHQPRAARLRSAGRKGGADAGPDSAPIR